MERSPDRAGRDRSELWAKQLLEACWISLLFPLIPLIPQILADGCAFDDDSVRPCDDGIKD